MMEKIKKIYTALKLLIGLDSAVVNELEAQAVRMYALEQDVKYLKGANKNLLKTIQSLQRSESVL